MTCPWKEIGQLPAGRKRVQCTDCGATASVPNQTNTSNIQGCRNANRPRPSVTVQTIGPGVELARILVSLGAEKTDGCGCEEMIAQMNAWGPDGCEQHLPEIVARLRKSYKATSWGKVTAAGMAAFTTGVVWHLNPTSPLESLVRLAIARARGL